MELKSTIFAAVMVLIITWRNMKIANLDGKKYRPYGLADLGELAPDTLKEFFALIKNRKKANSK